MHTHTHSKEHMKNEGKRKLQENKRIINEILENHSSTVYHLNKMFVFLFFFNKSQFVFGALLHIKQIAKYFAFFFPFSYACSFFRKKKFWINTYQIMFYLNWRRKKIFAVFFSSYLFVLVLYFRFRFPLSSYTYSILFSSFE